MLKSFFILITSLIITSMSYAQSGANDPTFNPGDIGLGTGDGTSRVRTCATQNDGKIIIGGGFTRYNSSVINRIARLNTDGRLDTTFNPGTGVNYNVLTVAIQGDGKIIIGGGFTSYNGTSVNHLARLNTDGSLDATFNAGTGADAIIWTSAIQNDGKIIIGGDFTNYNGTTINRIARLNTDGSLDTSFNPGIGIEEYYGHVLTVAIQSDGKITIGGEFTSYNGKAVNRIARLNANGSLDTTFNPGTGADDRIWTSAIQSDGKIIIGGEFTSYNGFRRKHIARLNSNGSLDTSFNQGKGTNNYIYATAIQSDEKIIIGGEFFIYNGLQTGGFARLNTDGTLDASFNPSTGVMGSVDATAIQMDGKIIITGVFSRYNGIGRNCIARLNTNGSLDTSFNPGTGVYGTLSIVDIQNDGKIIIGGWFTQYNGTSVNHLARLNADGSLDASFNPGTGVNGYLSTLDIQNDGKIIIGGDFTSYNGTTITNIARLNTDGSLDASFNPGTGINGYLSTIDIQYDGKIIIGGSFTSYSGINRRRIARLNVNGTLDTSFNPRAWVSGSVRSTATQSDGKIIVGGYIPNFNGTIINGIVRLNTDGSFDASFDPGTGTAGESSSVETIAIQSDGKIIIGGSFTSFNGTGRNRIARILMSPLEIPYVQVEDGLSIYPIPFSNQLTIETEGNSKTKRFEILNIMGQTITNGSFVSKTTIQTSHFASGVYFLRLESGDEVEFRKMVKE